LKFLLPEKSALELLFLGPYVSSISESLVSSSVTQEGWIFLGTPRLVHVKNMNEAKEGFEL